MLLRLRHLNIPLFMFAIFLLTGCASAPPLTDKGAMVRQINADQAKGCKFIRVVQYNDRIVAVGKDATVMKAIGDNGLRNHVADAGANAFVLMKDHSNWFLGTVAYEAEAYICL